MYVVAEQRFEVSQSHSVILLYMKSILRSAPRDTSKLLLLTNTWTYAKHGHARDELNQIKSFLTSQKLTSRIIGTSKSFGDYSRFSLGVLLHRAKFDHSRLFKSYVDQKLIQDLDSTLYRVSQDLDKDCSGVMLTSTKFSHFSKMLRIQDVECNLAVRFIDFPAENPSDGTLSITKNKNGFPVIFAIENKRSLNKIRDLNSNIIHVPPAQSLRIESEEVNQRRNRIGIFFPVGKPARIEYVLELLGATRHLNPIVKLPRNMMNKQIVSDFYDCDFLLPGMSDVAFKDVLSKIKVAILGHENYVHFSSAYASYFISNNVPIVTNKNNRFEDEFGSQLVFALPSKLQNKLDGVVKEIESNPMSIKRAPYANYAEEKWREFINRCIGQRNHDS